MIAVFSVFIAENLGPILLLSVAGGMLVGLVLDTWAEDADTDRALEEADADELIPPPDSRGGAR